MRVEKKTKLLPIIINSVSSTLSIQFKLVYGHHSSPVFYPDQPERKQNIPLPHKLSTASNSYILVTLFHIMFDLRHVTKNVKCTKVIELILILSRLLIKFAEFHWKMLEREVDRLTSKVFVLFSFVKGQFITLWRQEFRKTIQ